MAERKTLRDAIGVCAVHDCGLAQHAAAFGAFGLAKMASAGATAQRFAAGRDLESLCHRFFGLDAFGTSHNKSVPFKKSAQYMWRTRVKQAII